VLLDGAGASCPKSPLGVTSGSGVAYGATGATGFGRAIGLFGAHAAFAGGAAFADFAGAFFGADFFAVFAFVTTFALLAFLAFVLATFLATLFLAAARFAFAAGRFFPFAFFFAMVGHLLAVIGLHMRVAPKKSAVISLDAGVDDEDCVRSIGDAE
jgi:hypothetical protein